MVMGRLGAVDREIQSGVEHQILMLHAGPDPNSHPMLRILIKS